MSRIFVLGWVAACMTIYVITTPFIAFDLSILIPKSSGDVASWVQAVGSVIAIFVAIGFPLFQESRQRKDKRNKIINIAIKETKYIQGNIKSNIMRYNHGIMDKIMIPGYFDHYRPNEFYEVDYDLYRRIQEMINTIDAINSVLSQRKLEKKPNFPTAVKPGDIEEIILDLTKQILDRINFIQPHHTAPPSA